MSGFTTTIKADAVFTKPCVLGNENLIGPELPKPAVSVALVEVRKYRGVALN